MVVPNSGGYTLFSTTVRDMDGSMSRYHSKLLFQHKTKNYHHLFDRLVMSCPHLQEVVNFIKTVGNDQHWFRTFRGSVLNLMLRRYMLFVSSPNQYGFYGDFIFASNYSILKNYLDNIIGVLKHEHGLPNKYYRILIPKPKLIALSKLWANEMIPLCTTLLPKWDKLREKNT
ncbi:hypothetical protein N9X61_01185 [Sulfurimonas sp.]|nr:hypothetical protein [Sulfurimonas sp.]